MGKYRVSVTTPYPQACYLLPDKFVTNTENMKLSDSKEEKKNDNRFSLVQSGTTTTTTITTIININRNATLNNSRISTSIVETNDN